MTTVAKSSVRSRGRGAEGGEGAPGAKRAVTWGLHLLVSLLAVFSLFTNRFDLWMDLRMLAGAGGVGAEIVKIFWVGTVLLVPLCAGPRLRGIWKGRWVNRGFLPGAVHLLLWPTYFVLAALIVNTVYFFVLLRRGDVEWEIPVTMIAAGLLGAWVLFTREWVRVSARMAESTPVGRGRQLAAGLFGLVGAGFLSACFLLHGYVHPPARQVDLAVVLGGRVLPDGTASPALRDRTLAAIDLYKRGKVKHILLSGAVWAPKKAGDHQLNEVAAMEAVCQENGVPAEAISLDPVGVNTRATAYNTKIFMQQQGYSSVVACSTDFHLYRTAMCFRAEGIPAATAAAKPIEWICAKPHDDLREMIGVVVYMLDPNYRAPKAETMKIADPRVVVKKSAHVLELYDGLALVKTYACISGGNAGDKEIEGDRKTPLGSFHIVFKNPESKFHLSLGLDYPNREDAERGLKAGLISKDQFEQIATALRSDLSVPENQEKLWKTPLGGEIFLHGHAEGRSGTAGCVALSNTDIEELYAILPVGTAVEIHE